VMEKKLINNIERRSNIFDVRFAKQVSGLKMCMRQEILDSLPSKYIVGNRFIGFGYEWDIEVNEDILGECISVEISTPDGPMETYMGPISDDMVTVLGCSSVFENLDERIVNKSKEIYDQFGKHDCKLEVVMNENSQNSFATNCWFSRTVDLPKKAEKFNAGYYMWDIIICPELEDGELIFNHVPCVDGKPVTGDFEKNELRKALRKQEKARRLKGVRQ